MRVANARIVRKRKISVTSARMHHEGGKCTQSVENLRDFRAYAQLYEVRVANANTLYACMHSLSAQTCAAKSRFDDNYCKLMHARQRQL